MDTISVHDIVFDRTLNPRLHGVDTEVVEFYASIFTEVVWPPILVHRGTHKLLDGWHRVEAAKRNGTYTMPVLWVDAPEEELFALAVKANLGHGLHLSREERYQAISRLQRESWTDERIAEFLGCSVGMVRRTEKAEDLRIKFKVNDHPGVMLPIESLVEVAKLPQEYHDELAALACEVEAAPTDIRRAVKAVKDGIVDTKGDIRHAMMDAEFVKARRNSINSGNGNWLMTFATMVDQLEAAQITVTPPERDAALALFRRTRAWAEHQIMLFSQAQTPSMLE